MNDPGEKQTFSIPGASRRLTTMDAQAAAIATTALGAQTALPRRDDIQSLLAQVSCVQPTQPIPEAAKQ